MDEPVQRTVVFYGDELVAIQLPATSIIYVPLAILCTNLGIARNRQAQRIREHAVLGQGFTTLPVNTGGGTQEAQCLRIDLIPLWLAGVNANRVSESVREKLIRYQAEVATVLWSAFRHEIIPNTPQEMSANQGAIQQLQHIAEMGRAIAAMAEQQIDLQRQQQITNARIDRAGVVVRGLQHEVRALTGNVGDIQVRLGVLEDRLHPSAYITEEQATEVSQQVKALAEVLTGKDTAKNHYQGIFGELYRRYGVASYKVIRQEQYAAVLAFLEDWAQAAITDASTDAPSPE